LNATTLRTPIGNNTALSPEMTAARRRQPNGKEANAAPSRLLEGQANV
jgi:hypothetical protein